MGNSKTLSDRRQEAARGSKSDIPKANTCTKRTFCFENIVIQNIVLKTEQLSGPRRPEVVVPAHSAADDLPRTNQQEFSGRVSQGKVPEI